MVKVKTLTLFLHLQGKQLFLFAFKYDNHYRNFVDALYSTDKVPSIPRLLSFIMNQCWIFLHLLKWWGYSFILLIYYINLFLNAKSTCVYRINHHLVMVYNPFCLFVFCYCTCFSNILLRIVPCIFMMGISF